MSNDAEQHKMDAEASVKRNPHPNFKQVEGSREDWPERDWTYAKTRNPDWKFGQGATDSGERLTKDHVEIDPYEEGSTINIISEHFLEAANATSINAPYGVSEWALSGLTPAPCTTVKTSRVKESIFSIEGKLMETKEFESRGTPGKKTGVLAIIEGTRFWVREDAINEDKNQIDPAVLKPMSRLGGITYGRTTEGIEIPRPEWAKVSQSEEVKVLVKPKAEGQ
ncbi:MAG: hypothetical protein M1832_003702 [Thelocarpon impressellum]|nr:MAG: hypothetical protein M1832_003702 [Thelocarpon impressellum]